MKKLMISGALAFVLTGCGGMSGGGDSASSSGGEGAAAAAGKTTISRAVGSFTTVSR